MRRTRKRSRGRRPSRASGGKRIHVESLEARLTLSHAPLAIDDVGGGFGLGPFETSSSLDDASPGYYYSAAPSAFGHACGRQRPGQ